MDDLVPFGTLADTRQAEAQAVQARSDSEAALGRYGEDARQQVLGDPSSAQDAAASAFHALRWVYDVIERHQAQRDDVAAEELPAASRAALMERLLADRRAGRDDLEAIAVWWALAGAVPSTGDGSPLAATGLEAQIAERSASWAPLVRPGLVLNLLLALQPSVEEAQALGQEELLLNWNGEKARRLLPNHRQLTAALELALGAQGDEQAGGAPAARGELASLALVRHQREADRPPLPGEVAAWWALTGGAPPPLWRRGEVRRQIAVLEEQRTVPVDREAALVRLCDVLQVPRRTVSFLRYPEEIPDEWRRNHAVELREPDWEALERQGVKALTPWPNERVAVDPRAGLEDVAPDIRGQYRAAVEGRVTIGDSFLGTDGWFYVFLPRVRQPGGGLGRIICRRGKFYDEVPAWRLQAVVTETWRRVKQQRALDRDRAWVFGGAARASEEQLHDFWGSFGFNPPGYIRPGHGLDLGARGKGVARDAGPAGPSKASGVDTEGMSGPGGREGPPSQGVG